MIIYALVLIGFLFGSTNPATVFSSSLKTCQNQCEDRNLAYPLAPGELRWSEIDKFNYTLRTFSCKHGCEDVDERESKCHEKCREPEIITDACEQGCRAVLVAFLAQAQSLLIQARVDMEVMEQAMKLKWQFPKSAEENVKEIAAADIFWFSQTRPLHGKRGWRWSSLPNGSFRNASLSTEVNVPFEHGEHVEVRLALSYRNQVLVSRTTNYKLPFNKSGTTLDIIGQLQLSDDRVAVCYKTNQPTPKFKLAVATLDGNTLNTEESIARCHMFSNLPKENCCKATISAIDDDGGITAYQDILLDFFVNRVESELTGIPTVRMIFTNGSHILDSENPEEYGISDVVNVIPFPLSADDSITAIAGISENTIAIGSHKGSLWTFQMSANLTDEDQASTIIQLKIVEEMDHKITQIAIDHIQQNLYAVQYDKGILRCKLRSMNTEMSPCLLIVNNDALNPPREISIDPINGFIYILCADHKVYKSDMVAFNSTGIETLQNLQYLKELSPSNGIFYDISKFQLYSAHQNGSILSFNPITDQVHIFRDSGFGDVSNFKIKSKNIYWTKANCGDSDSDENCVFSENIKRAEDGIPNKFTYSSSLIDYTFTEEVFLKPRIAAVRQISFIVSDKIGRISWSVEQNMPFQAKSLNWRNTTYSLKVTAPEMSDYAPVHILTDTNDMTIDIKPNEMYNIQIQVCSEDFCSTPTLTSSTALSEFENGIPFVFTRKNEDQVESLDVLGFEIPTEDSVGKVEKMKYPHVLDNTTKTVYLAGDHSMGIYKRDLDDTTGIAKPFKDGLFVEMMSIMPSKSILILASSYKIISYRFPTTFDHEYYSCEEPLEDCAEVMGISSDDSTGKVHFLTQSQNGTVVLWEASQEDKTSRQISSTDRLDPFRRFLVVGEKIVLVTKSRHIVQADKNFRNINVAFQLPFVDRILPIRYAPNLHKIEFDDDIRFMDGSKIDLTWSLSPPLESGTVLYKVSIYRDKFGVDSPIVNMQLDTNYTIPSHVLEQWSSAQRFDVSVQAITPWTSIVLNKTGLLAPVKPPTPPTQLRIYATQQKTVDGPRALISFFWTAPIEWNGTPYQYIVNCTKDDGSWIGGPVSTSQSHYSFAVKSGKVSCQAAAANEPTNVGAFSELISIDSSELKPLVKLFAIDSTNSLIAINDLAHEEPRRETRDVSQPIRLEYQALAFIGEDLYAVRKEGDSAQPILVQIDTNHIDNVVHKVSIGGDVTRIDAMTSDWVGHRLLFVAGTVLYQLPLEPFMSTSLLNPHKLIQLTADTDAKQLTYDPFMNTAYLLTKNGSIFALDLNKNTEANLALTISCLTSQTVTWMMTEFAWNRATSPKIYALTWNGLIYINLAEDYQCNEVRIDWSKFGEKGLKSISSFAIADKLFAFVTSSEMLIYGGDTVTPILITNPPLKQILAVSQSSQPYPDRSCFELPSSKEIVFSIVNEGKTGAFLEVTKSLLPSACQYVSMPQTQYELYFTRKNTDKVKHVRSYSDKIHLENGILDKETEYDVTMTWLNRYSPASGVSGSKSFRTGFGYPSAPRDPHAIAVTPDTVYLYWNLPETLNAPISEIKYKISQQATGFSSPTSIAVIPLSEVVLSNTSSDSAACLINPCRVKIANLRPSNEYKFWITATHVTHLDSTFLKDDDAVSSETTARTLDVPGTLRPDNVTGSSLLLRWNGLEPEQKPSTISVQYKETGESNEWQSPTNATFEPDVITELILVPNLLSATSYDYRFVATYTGTYDIDGKVLAFKEDYFQLVQQARTKAGVPTAPQNVESRMDEEGWIVTWKEPMSDGGASITSYAVEMRINKTAEWEIAERGLDRWKMWWRPGKTETQQNDLEFRIRAANIEGFGAYGYIEEKEEIASEESSSFLPILLFLFIILLIIMTITVLCFWIKSRKKQKMKKREAADERNCISLDVVTNMEFSPSQRLPLEINNELKNLPHINKEDIRIGVLIARGSYGNVHEAIAKEVPLSWEKNVKVAVKTLKEDYSYQDKVFFMKEAILLNNVDHPNIVKELGVCLTQGSEMILLEYMEGGNLLDLLRDSVPTENQPSELCLRDLLGISVDVARGMNYLERLPHIHRNLSARQCLLSGKVGMRRCVVTKLKMSDSRRFIGNTSNLRSEIESSDIIRWMAPETLKDFHFSSKSDVWAFGVLLYEIFSLGEHPFEDVPNRKVITDVRNGAILQKPIYCPDRLYKLMQQCWVFDAAKRPNFATILKIFESFRERMEFQDGKPIQAHDGYNVNFDASHDSTSSERGDTREPPSPSHLNKSFGGFENQIYDVEKSSLRSMINTKKAVKTSTVGKSLRKEKAKQRASLPFFDDCDSGKNQRPLSIHSGDTASTDNGGDKATSSFHSPASSSHHFPLQGQYLTTESNKPRQFSGVVNDGYESSNPSLNLSRSWTAVSGEINPNNSGVSTNPQNQLSLHATSSSAGHLRQLMNGSNSRGRSHAPSYEQARRNRVSQV